MNGEKVARTLRTRRAHDGAIGVGLFALAIVTTGQFVDNDPATLTRDLAGWALLAGQTLPLIWRQTAPRLVMALTALAWVLDRGLNYEQTLAGVGIVVAVHALGAYLPRTESTASAIAGADIERHPDNGNVQLIRGTALRQAKHGAGAGETRHFVSTEWLVIVVGHRDRRIGSRLNIPAGPVRGQIDAISHCSMPAATADDDPRGALRS